MLNVLTVIVALSVCFAASVTDVVQARSNGEFLATSSIFDTDLPLLLSPKFRACHQLIDTFVNVCLFSAY